MHARLRDAPKPEQAPHADKELALMSSRSIRMLRLPQVIDATGLGKTKIYELQGQGDFPMRVKITAHSVAWVEEEVQAWLAARIVRARSETATPRTQRPQATRRKER
jgi:prophage regulatory protein